MKPCASCPNPTACAKAGKCAAAKPAPKRGAAQPMSVPASKRKTGRYYIPRQD